MSESLERSPKGELLTRTLAMPADTNPNGDIFGGWILSQMDIAGGIMAGKYSQGRSVTVAIDAMSFHLPVHVGDVVCCYGQILKTGKTSMTLHLEVWAIRELEINRILVTEGHFTYVAIDSNHRPRQLTK